MKITLAALLLVCLLALALPCTAFLAARPQRKAAIITRRMSIEGAAKDAEEDLKLTLKIIMDFNERQQAKEAKDKAEIADEKADHEIEDDTEDEEVKSKDKAIGEKTPKEEAPKLKDKVKEEPPKKPATTKGFVIPTSKVTIPKARKPSTTPPKTKRPPPTPLQSKKGLYSPDKAPTVELDRQFRFVDIEEKTFKITDGKPSISCDGRIPVTSTLELSSSGTETPDELYADTSTEMALKLAQHSDYTEQTKDAWVLHNRFDTAGVLCVYACLEPLKALEYSELLIAAAEAGEFGEWNSDEGVKLDCALQELRSQHNGEGISFLLALTDHLPGLLKDFHETGGENHVDIWGPRYEKVLKSWESFEQNQVVLSAFHDDLVIVERSWNVPPVSPYALQRKLKEQGIELTTQRILHVLTDVTGSRFKYETIGHGWVPKLVERPTLSSVDADQLVEDLNKEYAKAKWKKSDGPVGICQSLDITTTPVEEVAEYLLAHDDGL